MGDAKTVFPYCSEHSKVEALLEEREKQTCTKIAAIVESIRAAKIEMDRRLEGMNEFRQQLSVQAATFIPKREVELILDKLVVRISNLEDVSSKRTGSTRWSDHIITVLIASAVFALAHFIFKF